MSLRHIVPLAALALSLPASSLPASAQTAPLREKVAADMPGLMEIYRDLHANPELGFTEVRTAAILAKAAREAGFEVTENVGKTGVVAVLRNGPGPTLMIRTDMDALPLEEKTGLPFASTKRAASVTSGVESYVMHACGHDTHMTAWIETARLLAARRDQWSGTLVMIGQPAEELGQGARAMIKDGLFERFPKPDYVLAFHDSADLAAGVLGGTEGFAMANTDSVDIEVKGEGGHGASPHTTKDPIVLASAIVNKLQTIVSREQNPTDPAVVTVGSIHAGATYNIIPDTAKLQLTVRTYSDTTRERVLAAIKRIARGEAIASGIAEDSLPVVMVKEEYTRATYNSPDLAADMLANFRERFGTDRVKVLPPAMVGEDFGEYYLADPEHRKSMLFRVGGVPAEKFAAARRDGAELPSLHSPFWAPDAEAVVGTAAEALTATTMRLLAKSGES
ncbi:peptidase M20 [Novosphingobium sp. PC22D]|uniref:amidohydrolase n=1 Tax=Novosphingobium sp. PC22D TaxID=1962403 RepID=UPI000BF05F72|nr:amidohydrolase [Novosphingobium sp. PC22D]PEQ11065.1 peptidase M20 [Novosphingobium sp. PC22D]